jgi:hypothetical protein
MDTGQDNSSTSAGAQPTTENTAAIEALDSFIREAFGLAVYLVICSGKEVEHVGRHERLVALYVLMKMHLEQCRKKPTHGTPPHIRMRDARDTYEQLYYTAYGKQAVEYGIKHALIDGVIRQAVITHPPSELTELGSNIFHQPLSSQSEQRGSFTNTTMPAAGTSTRWARSRPAVVSSPPQVEKSKVKQVERPREVGPHAEFLEKLFELRCKPGEVARIKKRLGEDGRTPEDVANGYAMAGARPLAEMIMKALGKDPAQLAPKQVPARELEIEPKGAAYGRRSRGRGKGV